MNKYIRLINLPCRIKGMTATDADGNYNIYLNNNLSYEAQVQALLHEITHINHNDFSNSVPVVSLENKTDKFCAEYKRGGADHDYRPFAKEGE